MVSLSCGSNHTIAVTRKGKVYSFGDNKSMQCGHEIKTESIKLDNSDMSSGSPEKIGHFEKRRVRLTFQLPFKEILVLMPSISD